MPHRACLPMNYKSNICEKERISHSWTDAILLPISCKLNSINFLSDNHQANLTEEAGIKPATKFSLDNQLSKKWTSCYILPITGKNWRAQEVHMIKARPFLNWNWHKVRFHKLVSCEILTLKKSQQDDEAGCVHRDYSSWSQARAIRKFLFVVFNISYHILSKKVRI